MRHSYLVPLLLLSACSVQKTPNEAAPTDNGMAAAPPTDTASPATSTADVLAGTSWTFTPDAKTGLITATFGTDGHYYDINNGKMVESGTFVSKDGKVCENVDGTPQDDHVCWTIPNPLPPIGGTADTTSDKGQTVTLTRIAFAGNQAKG